MKLLETIAEVESKIGQAEQTRDNISHAAEEMRVVRQARIAELATVGTLTDEQRDEYKGLLVERHRCDLIGAMNS